MTDETVTMSFQITAEGMPQQPKRSRLERLWRWIRRIPEPPLEQPPGTQPLYIEQRDGDRIIRFYIPAARIEPTPEVSQ